MPSLSFVTNRIISASFTFIIICVFGSARSAVGATNTSLWTKFNVVVDPGGFKNSAEILTTETSGIIIRVDANRTTKLQGLTTYIWSHEVEATTPWQQEEQPFVPVSTVIVPPTTTSAPIQQPTLRTTQRSTTAATAILQPLTTAATLFHAVVSNTNRSTTNRKKNSRKEDYLDMGYSLITGDDEDDEDEEEDEDEDEEEEYEEEVGNKSDEYEVEEPHKDDLADDENHGDTNNNVEETVETVHSVPHDEYDNYPETHPTIVLRRKKKKRKRGKKHGSIKVKDFKKLRKFMLPLLLAYKLKFFTLVPLLLGGLVLIVATTGFAGFFFALFAVGLGLKHH